MVAEPEGYMIFEYQRSCALPDCNPEDIVITGQKIWILRPWVSHFEVYGDGDRCVCYTKVTKYEMLPALLEARARGILDGPKDVESMLDEQLLVMNTKATDDARSVGERIVAVLSLLPTGLQVVNLPLIKVKLFPKPFALKRACETCYNKVFTECYEIKSHKSDDTSLLTDDTLTWILRSFKWGVTLATDEQDIHKKWICHSYMFGKTNTGIPMLVEDATEMDVWIMPSNVTLFRVTGLGLPKVSPELTKYVLTNVSQSLREIFTPAQDGLCDVDYNIGGDISVRFGITRYIKSHFCAYCNVQHSLYGDIGHYRVKNVMM